jgi:hypothetical protein
VTGVVVQRDLSAGIRRLRSMNLGATTCDMDSIGARGVCFTSLRSELSEQLRALRGPRALGINAASEVASASGRAPQSNDRQMSLPVDSLYFDIESRAESACDEDLRPGARRTAGPLRREAYTSVDISSRGRTAGPCR